MYFAVLFAFLFVFYAIFNSSMHIYFYLQTCVPFIAFKLFLKLLTHCC